MCATAPPLKVFFRRLLQVHSGNRFFSSEAEPVTVGAQGSVSRSRRNFLFAKRFNRRSHARLSAGRDVIEEEDDLELEKPDKKTLPGPFDDSFSNIDENSRRLVTVQAHSETAHSRREFQPLRPITAEGDSTKVPSSVVG